jgi:hypothetical protein
MVAKPEMALTETLQALEQARFDAMVDADGQALERLMSEKLIYIHTNGKRETRAQFIAALSAGHRRYQQIEVQDLEVVSFGEDTAVASGRALIEMETNNGALLFSIAYTAFHVRQADQWRLTVWQATRRAND